MGARSKIEALRSEGLVLEGQYPDIRDISVTQGGRSESMEVRPLVLKKADLTVLRPALRTMTAGQEYRV